MVERKVRRLTTAIAILVVSLSGPVLAEEPPTSSTADYSSPSDSVSTAGNLDVADAEVRTFARVLLKIQERARAAQEKIATTSDPDESERIRAEMQRDLGEIVQASPLSTERFAEIQRAMGGDTELKKRIGRAVYELRESSD